MLTVQHELTLETARHNCSEESPLAVKLREEKDVELLEQLRDIRESLRGIRKTSPPAILFFLVTELSLLRKKVEDKYWTVFPSWFGGDARNPVSNG